MATTMYDIGEHVFLWDAEFNGVRKLSVERIVIEEKTRLYCLKDSLSGYGCSRHESELHRSWEDAIDRMKRKCLIAYGASQVAPAPTKGE